MPTNNPDRALSQRERQILQLASAGLTDKAIASEIGISPTTVNTFWGRIRYKMGQASRAELVGSLARMEAEEDLRAAKALNDALLVEIALHRRTQEKLAESEARFRHLVDSVPDALVVVREDGLIDLVNNRFEEVFGYAKAEILGMPLDMLIPKRFKSRHRELASEFFATPRVRKMGGEMLFECARKDGSEFLAEIMLSPFSLGDLNLTVASIREKF